jgi:hypothetical protein
MSEYKQDNSTKDFINKCNDQIENTIKNETFVLQGIYDKDPKYISAYAIIKGFHVQVDLEKIEGQVRDRWLSESSKLENGDVFKFTGKFHLVDREISKEPGEAYFWFQARELRLGDIYNFEPVKTEKTDKVNLTGKIYFDYERFRMYKESSNIEYADLLSNIKIKALDEKNQEYFATTDRNGVYEFKDLTLGKYKLSIDYNTIKPTYKGKYQIIGVAAGPSFDGLTRLIYINGSNKNVDMGESFKLLNMSNQKYT